MRQVVTILGFVPPGRKIHRNGRQWLVIHCQIALRRGMKNATEFQENSGLGQHRVQKLHGQPNHVRFAAFDDVQPARAILVAERACLAFPQAAVQVFLDLIGLKESMRKRRAGDADLRLRAPEVRQTKPAVNPVFAATQQSSICRACSRSRRFSQDPPQALPHRVAGHDHQRTGDLSDRLVRRPNLVLDGPLGQLGGDVGGFLTGQPGHQFAGCFLAANAALGIRARHHDFEAITGLGQQRASLRRAAGQKSECQSRLSILLLRMGANSRSYPLDGRSQDAIRRRRMAMLEQILGDPVRRQPLAGRQQARRIADHGRGRRRSELYLLAQQYIKRRNEKPGNVYLGIMSRLDAGSSGVVLLARTSKAAARLTEQFRTRSVREDLLGDRDRRRRSLRLGEMVDWLRKDEAKGRMEIVAADQPGRQGGPSELSPRTSRRRGTLVEIDLQTRSQASDSRCNSPHAAGRCGANENTVMRRRC